MGKRTTVLNSPGRTYVKLRGKSWMLGNLRKLHVLLSFCSDMGIFCVQSHKTQPSKASAALCSLSETFLQS